MDKDKQERIKNKDGWIGVDLDGTLAEYHGGHDLSYIGPPIAAMLARVRGWLAQGWRVKIFTARAVIPEQVLPIQAWLVEHGLPALEVTNIKDFEMVELWDDRAITVITNTGFAPFVQKL